MKVSKPGMGNSKRWIKKNSPKAIKKFGKNQLQSDLKKLIYVVTLT